MIPIILESPYSGTSRNHLLRWLQRLANVRYARLCLLDALRRGEAPLASHLLYTQVLDDSMLFERNHGMNAGFVWTPYARRVVVYTDRGISGGMEKGIKIAERVNVPIVYRSLYKGR